jgi:lipoate-protein ligase A
VDVVDDADVAPPPPPPRLAWLDLRGMGLSVLERLVIDELLLRHDDDARGGMAGGGVRNWAIVGTHEPVTNGILLPSQTSTTNVDANDDDDVNGSCVIVMGIGGKPEKLLNINDVTADGVLVLRRFTGGGTVVVDHSSLLVSLIVRNEDDDDDDDGGSSSTSSSSARSIDGGGGRQRRYRDPRKIMEWTLDQVYGPAFDGWNEEIVTKRRRQKRDANMVASSSSSTTTTTAGGGDGRRTLIFHGKSCGLSGGDGASMTHRAPGVVRSNDGGYDRIMPNIRLVENDYVLDGRKFGGNAQCISSGGFLHHTSFLWDWNDDNMNYLSLPHKRPTYRGDRSHGEFLVRLKDTYGGGDGGERNSLFRHVKRAMGGRYRLEEATLRDVLDIADEKFGGLQGWFDGKCRTSVVSLR